MKFSGRLIHGSPLNALAAALARNHAQGLPVLDLTESNPTRAGIEYPRGFLGALADERVLRYEPEPFGLLSARERIAGEYNAPLDCVMLTASTSEAYSWLFKLLCDPGCEVLVPRPSYPLFEYLAALESVTVRHYGLFYDHGWFIDFHSLENALNERSRAVILVNPNNPTGHFIHRHELEHLAELCARYDIALISDEVFSDYTIHADLDSVLTLRGVADFTLNGLSKSIGLPQMKLAWIISKQPGAGARNHCRHVSFGGHAGAGGAARPARNQGSGAAPDPLAGARKPRAARSPAACRGGLVCHCARDG